MKQRFKTKELQKFYELCRRSGTDETSGFWFTDTDGTKRPRRGAGHRASYWNGRSGLQLHHVLRTAGHAAWRAGRDDLTDFGPVARSDFASYTGIR